MSLKETYLKILAECYSKKLITEDDEQNINRLMQLIKTKDKDNVELAKMLAPSNGINIAPHFNKYISELLNGNFDSIDDAIELSGIFGDFSVIKSKLSNDIAKLLNRDLEMEFDLSKLDKDMDYYDQNAISLLLYYLKSMKNLGNRFYLLDNYEQEPPYYWLYDGKNNKAYKIYDSDIPLDGQKILCLFAAENPDITDIEMVDNPFDVYSYKCGGAYYIKYSKNLYGYDVEKDELHFLMSVGANSRKNVWIKEFNGDKRDKYITNKIHLFLYMLQNKKIKKFGDFHIVEDLNTPTAKEYRIYTNRPLSSYVFAKDNDGIIIRGLQYDDYLEVEEFKKKFPKLTDYMLKLVK